MLSFVKNNISFFKTLNLVTTASTGRALSAIGIEPKSLVSSGPLGMIIIMYFISYFRSFLCLEACSSLSLFLYYAINMMDYIVFLLQ